MATDYTIPKEEYRDLLARLERLEAENDELRKELAQWERLTAGIKLPEYPITAFRPKDIERENAKLRGLLSTALGQVREMCESNKDRCAACPLHHGHDECRMVMVRNEAREIGVEVTA